LIINNGTAGIQEGGDEDERREEKESARPCRSRISVAWMLIGEFGDLGISDEAHNGVHDPVGVAYQ